MTSSSRIVSDERARRLARSLANVATPLVRAPVAPREARDMLAYLYKYRPLSYSARIRHEHAGDVVPATRTVDVQLRNCFVGHGNPTVNEVYTLCALVRALGPRAVFEFGTHKGLTTLQLALNAPDATVHTLNLPLDHGDTVLGSAAGERLVQPKHVGSGQHFAGQPEEARIHPLFGDSATFDFSPYAGTIDFVFIDAGHEYDYVKADTDHARELLRDGTGHVAWHDFTTAPGVTSYLNDLAASQTVYHLAGTTLAYAKFE